MKSRKKQKHVLENLGYRRHNPHKLFNQCRTKNNEYGHIFVVFCNKNNE